MPERTITGYPVTCLLLALSVSHAASGDTTLQTNPFIQPDDNAALQGHANGKTRDNGTQTMELRGIIRAGTYSLADIGGSIVGIGEVVNGYTLVAVHELHVVLDKDGTRNELPVTGEQGAGGNE